MNALWNDPPYIDNPAGNIPKDKFQVTKLDMYDHDESRLKLFDTLEEAIDYAKKCQSLAPDDLTAHRVWNDEGRVIARFDP